MVSQRLECEGVFLNDYKQYTYLSFGKWMYTQQRAARQSSRMRSGNQSSSILESDAGFGLDLFAFTAETYCFGRSGHSHWPSWTGRCKVMARPAYHPQWDLHDFSSIILEKNMQAIHFDAANGTSIAHINEWSFLATKDPDLQAEFQTPGSTFTVPRGSPTGTVFPFKAHKLTKAGETELSWDSTLHNWFSFVASGCGRL